MGTQSKRKKATPDNRNVTSDIKREIDLDAVRTAILPQFEGIDYAPQLITQTDYVDVWDELNVVQLPPAIPKAPKGLVVSSITISNAVLNCNAVAANPSTSSYKFYYSTDPTFATGVTIFNPSSPNTGIGPLTAGAVYYARCTAINALGEGPFSSTVTFATPGIEPTLLLHLDGDLQDSITGSFLNSSHITNGFITPGRFGSGALKLNYPIDPAVNNKDKIFVSSTFSGIQNPTSPTGLFSLSFWIYPQDLSSLSQRRVLAAKREDSTNRWQIDIDNLGVARFCVRVNGSDSVCEVSGFTIGSWQMITVTWAVPNLSSQTFKIYRNAVLGTSSATAAQGLSEPPASAYNDLLFGQNTANLDDTSYYEGYYDEVQYYKGIELTQAQITNLFTTNSPTTVSSDTTPPAQTVGLSATAISDSQINLSWTASTAIDLNSYNVYRGTTSGFTVTPGVTTPTAIVGTNSYSDTGLSASTIYYYKVLAVDAAGNMGTLSTQASATTQAPPPAIPSLELHLDSSSVDSSSNAHSISLSNGNGYITPGVFGSAGWKCNYPITTGFDGISAAAATNPVSLQMDTSSGFSISLWVNPQDLSTISFRRVLYEKPDDGTNKFSLQIEGGTAYFFVKKGGVDYKAEVSGFVTGSWQHIAATFKGSTNTALIYRNAVVGTASSATPQYPPSSSDGGPAQNYTHLGYRYSAVPSWPDGKGVDTSYMGYYDEIRYYRSVVLSPTQITNLKNTNAP